MSQVEKAKNYSPAMVKIGKMLLIPFFALFLFIGPISKHQVLVPGDIAATVDDVWASPVPAHNPLLADVLYQFYPWQHFFHQQLHRGELPLWNPHELAGTPFMANNQSGVFDPVHWLTFILGFGAAGSFLPAAIIRLILFGLLFAWWLRGRNMSTGVSVAVGAMAIVTTPFIAWLSYPLFASFIWLPLILGGIDRLSSRPKRSLVFIALGLTGSIFSGNIEIALLVAIISAAYSLFVPSGRQFKSVSWSLAGLAVGAMLAAVQLLPSAAFIQQSTTYDTGRSGYAGKNIITAISHGDWLGWHSLGDAKAQIKRLLPIVQPEVFGNPATNSYRAPDNTVQNNFNELAGAIGLIGLWLAFVGVITAWRERIVKYFSFATVAMIGVVIHAPVFELVNYLPLIQQISTGRLRLFVAFGLLILAAYGLRTLGEKISRRQRIILSIGGLMIGGLYGWLTLIAPTANRRAGLIVVLASLVAIGLAVWLNRWLKYRVASLVLVSLVAGWVMMNNYNTAVKAEALLPTRPITNEISRLAGGQRIIGISSPGKYIPLRPNDAMLLSLRDVRGYEVVRLKRFEQLTAGLFVKTGSYLIAAEKPSPIFNMMSVKVGVIADHDSAGLTDWLASGWSITKRQSGITLLQNNAVWPRAFFIDHPQQISTPAAALTIAQQKITTPAQTVVETGRDVPADENISNTNIVITNESANQVTLSLHAPTAGYVVLNDSYDPGWRATVDGKDTSVFAANYAFRAVRVPAGARQIIFQYQPTTYVIGGWVSIVTGIALAGLGGFWVYTKRRKI